MAIDSKDPGWSGAAAVSQSPRSFTDHSNETLGMTSTQNMNSSDITSDMNSGQTAGSQGANWTPTQSSHSDDAAAAARAARNAELAARFPPPPRALPPDSASAHSPAPTVRAGIPVTLSVHRGEAGQTPLQPAQLPFIPATSASLLREPVPQPSVSFASSASSFGSNVDNPTADSEQTTCQLAELHLAQATSPGPGRGGNDPVLHLPPRAINTAQFAAPPSQAFAPIEITLPRLALPAARPPTSPSLNASPSSPPTPSSVAPTTRTVQPSLPEMAPARREPPDWLTSSSSAPISSTSRAPAPISKPPHELETELIWEIYHLNERTGKQLEALSPFHGSPPNFSMGMPISSTANNTVYQQSISLLQSEIAQVRSYYPKISELERLRDGDSWFRADKLRAQLEKTISDCEKAIGIYTEMIGSSYKTQANMLSIQQDANDYTTRTIREVNARRQAAFDVGNQKWSNVFNYGMEAPWVCSVCGGRFLRYGQLHDCRW